MPNDVDPLYRKKIEQIKIDGEDFASNAMKDVFVEHKAALDQLHRLISKMYIDHAKDGLLNLTSAQRNDLTATVKATLKEMGISLAKSESSKVYRMLIEIFKTTYYQSAFVLESGMKTNIKLNLLKNEFVASAVNSKFKGELFSKRIWENKASMMDKLQSSIIQAMKGEIHLDKVARNMRDTFNATAYQSMRLVMTEAARVQTQATDDVGRSTGVTQQMYSATLDMKTNPVDASCDGNVYDINDSGKPKIPNHPNCRCCFVNVPYAGWSPTSRRDNSTGKNIGYATYKDWAESKGIY
ncbi:minor capsid protein [Desulfosporosinus metallidurans]|uniref:Phage protein n=1 Tax=Desulfosporosinus metallidurans TaxID=1888891 RepID=A0A1Q8QJM3_9FIRM|nr:minor capsid protein [Desulfosporosinus metallidurans]OLN27535.1 Phage protein [Desulfosporosinus metallidurans]